MDTPMPAPPSSKHQKRLEIGAFAFLAFVLAPVLAVLIVGGYGFMIWIWQMVHGPPGPPPP